MYKHSEVEKSIQDFWKQNDIKAKVWKMRNIDKLCYFWDGPPYVTRQIHSGTGWNKIVKEVIFISFR